MNITDKSGLDTAQQLKNINKLERRPKKNLSSQQIRDMVSANTKKNGKGIPLEESPLRKPRSKENQNKLRDALTDGTVNFSTKERAIIEKILGQKA